MKCCIFLIYCTKSLREQEKQLAILETQLAAAKLKGFVPDGFNNVNSSSKVLLAVIGVNTGFGEKKRRDSLRSTWFPTGKLQLQMNFLVDIDS